MILVPLMLVTCATDLQIYMATGSRPSHSLEMATRPPASYGIATMPQPVSAPMLLYHHGQTSLAGVHIWACLHHICSVTLWYLHTSHHAIKGICCWKPRVHFIST